MKKFKNNVLCILFTFGISLSSFAQSSNKKRVLVVPCSRFEFVSEFTLDEIAQKNDFETKTVFLNYEKALLNSFAIYKDENFEFIPVEATTINSYKKLIKYEFGKFNGKHFNKVDIKLISEKDFTALLAHYNADFILFITWYDIQKESFTRGSKQSKRVPYAAHYIDYDVYNLFKQEVMGQGKIQAEANIPNDLEASFKLLRIKELESAYSNFIAKIIVQFNKPIEN